MSCRKCCHARDRHGDYGCRDCTPYDRCYGFHPTYEPGPEVVRVYTLQEGR